MRTVAAVPAVLALLAAGCADLPTAAPRAPEAPAGAFQVELSCTARVDRPQLSCSAAGEEGGSESRPSLIIGGQNVYVRLESSGAAYNPSDSIFQVDVTVENLMAQAFGTPDEINDTGLRVFFYTAPLTTGGSGSVTVNNADGTDIFLSSPTPYFYYSGLLYTQNVSAPKTWQFKADPEVVTFHFKVLVHGQLPHEQSVLLFRPWYEDDLADVIALWGPSASQMFAVGGSGQLLRYTGGAWVEDNGPTEETLWDVWGTSATDVFAVGEFGTILHWDGTDWEEMDSGLGCGCESLYGVWAAAPNDAWAVGDSGVIVHYDGTQWVPQDTMPVQWLGGVWGSAANDVWAVGDDGSAFHYDGTSWTQVTTGMEGQNEWLNTVWGLSSTDVYAASSNGVLRWDGTDWTPLPGLIACPHYTVWGTAPDDLFVTNACGVQHWDGDSWAYMDSGGFATDLWGFGPHNVITNSHNDIFRGTR